MFLSRLNEFFSLSLCLLAGEVVSIAQLASLAGRPVSSCQGSKPVTFQLQGNKLTLSGAQLHQVPVAPPRPVQGQPQACLHPVEFISFYIINMKKYTFSLTLYMFSKSCLTLVCCAGNVMHLVSSGGQHHLISQPAQVAMFSTPNTHAAGGNPANPAPAGMQLPHNASPGTFTIIHLADAFIQSDLQERAFQSA